MGKLLYFDGAIAVSLFDIEERIDERTIKLLLEVDADNPDIEKHVKPLLECPAVPHFIAYALLSDVEKAVIKERADVAALKELGFGVDGDRISPLSGLTPAIPNHARMLISVPQAVKRISGLANYLQYLAKLYLLANGDVRSESVLPEIRQTEYALEFDAVIPAGFAPNIARFRLNTPAQFDVDQGVLEKTDRVSRFEHDYWFTVPVGILYDDMMRFPREQLGESDTTDDVKSYALPQDSFMLKRIAASFLLTSLINYQSAKPFVNDWETLAIKRDDSESFASVLGDLMIAGKVSACPWCGRPVLLPRKSSKPFCRQSHQTRYSEKARAVLNDGATVDEVADAFPHIQYATISGWLPMEGR